MVTASEIIEDVRREVRADLRDLRESLTKAALRIEVLETRTKADGGLIRTLEAQSLVFQERITKLHVQNEEARALLHRAVRWIDRAVLQTEGMAAELLQEAEDLAQEIDTEERQARG